MTNTISPVVETLTQTILNDWLTGAVKIVSALVSHSSRILSVPLSKPQKPTERKRAPAPHKESVRHLRPSYTDLSNNMWT